MTKKPKKNIYIALFIFLGFLIGVFLHAVIEIFYIKFLLRNFELFSFGLSWNGLLLLHGVHTIFWTLFGIWFGYIEGVYWWREIYEKGRIRKWFKLFHR